MNKELSSLVDLLNDPLLSDMPVITWGSPVLSFGNPESSKIATLGLNPSNREFVDEEGKELEGTFRRFHTLNSLGIHKWADIKDEHFGLILELCRNYFFRNPYNGWFKKLDYIISGTSKSYYFPSSEACHLDLIPYATERKWSYLTSEQQTLLLEISSQTLGNLLKNSKVELIVLNGQTVVDNLQKIAGVELEKNHMPSWTLPRKSNIGVAGYSYTGVIKYLGGIKLKQDIKILGYNHNIQSSYGVTTKVQTAIRNWISAQAKEVFI